MARNILLSGLLLIAVLFLAGKAGLSTLEVITVSVLAVIGWIAITYRTLSAVKQGEAVQGSSTESDNQGKYRLSRHLTHDSLFGPIHLTENDEPYLWLSDVSSVANAETEFSFTAHLIRLMSSLRPDCNVVLLGETSAPDFQSILEKIAKEQIGKIVIRARDDVNPHTKTLECSLHLIHGIVTIRPEWNGWQPERAEEIVSTLLLPLVKQSLLGRVRIERPDGDQETLPNNFMAVIGAVLELSGHPLSTSQLPERMPRYIRMLVSAQ